MVPQLRHHLLIALCYFHKQNVISQRIRRWLEMFKEQEMYAQETSRSGVASATIFLIEDQLVLGMIMKRIITEHTPYQVLHLSEGNHILQMLQEHRPQL